MTELTERTWTKLRDMGSLYGSIKYVDTVKHSGNRNTQLLTKMAGAVELDI